MIYDIESIFIFYDPVYYYLRSEMRELAGLGERAFLAAIY